MRNENALIYAVLLRGESPALYKPQVLDTKEGPNGLLAVMITWIIPILSSST